MWKLATRADTKEGLKPAKRLSYLDCHHNYHGPTDASVRSSSVVFIASSNRPASAYAAPPGTLLNKKPQEVSPGGGLLLWFNLSGM